MNERSKKPKVSVCVVTYNQERYIRDCLQSLIDQDVEFPIEVLVGDDGSTDGTREIVVEFADRFPELIKAVLHNENRGSNSNYASIHYRASGEYVAHMDGDDYALPGKLAALARVLDEEPETNIVWHRMYVLNEYGQKALGMPLEDPEELFGKTSLGLLDVCAYYGATGCHSGTMYRRSARTLTGANTDGVIIDYYRTISLLSNGGFATYIQEPFGVYRCFSGDMTISKEVDGRTIGEAKLNIYRDYSYLGYAVRRRFAAQAIFDAFVRLYVGQPMVFDFVKAAFKMAALPMPSDFVRIWRIFNASRRTKLVAAWNAESPRKYD